MNDITRADVQRFLAGDFPPNSPKWKRIMDDLEHYPDGFVAQTLEQLTAESLDQVEVRMDAIWNQVMSIPEANLPEQNGGEDDWEEEALEFDDYWKMDEYDLSVELSGYEEEEVVLRSGGRPLEAYRELLCEFISKEWNWPAKRSMPEFSDPVFAAQSLAAAIKSSQLALPFPPELLAVMIVKSGIDSWCK